MSELQDPTPHKVLVVEDSREFSFLLKELLESEGYSVHVCENGREALDHLHAAPILPHLILLDIKMPIMNGDEFRQAQRLSSRLASIPVVVMTAHEDIQNTVIRLDAKDGIRKPPDLDVILNTVSRWIPRSPTKN